MTTKQLAPFTIHNYASSINVREFAARFLPNDFLFERTLPIPWCRATRLPVVRILPCTQYDFFEKTFEIEMAERFAGKVYSKVSHSLCELESATTASIACFIVAV